MSCPEGAVLLIGLQLSDSAFPTGGFAFSSGLEALVGEEIVSSEGDLAVVMHEELVHRWNTMDRVLLARAWDAPAPAERLVVDLAAEVRSVNHVLRRGSRRAGSALLSSFSRLGYADAIDYYELVRSSAAPGHLPVAQAVGYRAAGLDLAMAQMVSGWSMLAGLANAAVRIGVVGHLGAQRALNQLRPVLAAKLVDPTPSDLSAFNPLADIAAARVIAGRTRMFAT